MYERTSFERELASLDLRQHEQGAGTTKACPGYERGEAQASKKEPGILARPVTVLTPDTLLVADFGVDWRHVKPATKSHPELLRWLRAADPTTTFEVVGYSDCVATPVLNDRLRIGRARNVAALVGSRVTSVKKAPRGSYVASNLTRDGRAMNRGATIRAIPATAPWKPPVFVPPESVVEMQEALDEAEGLLDPYQLSLVARRRLLGPGPLAVPYEPDIAGALLRIDSVLAFVKPFVEPANVRAHARDDLEAKYLGLFHTTTWLDRARTSHGIVRRLRDGLGSSPGAAAVIDLATKAKGELGLKVAEPLKVLADEGLSFELELGSSPKPARSYRSSLRQEFAGGQALTKRELRVLAWLKDHKGAILDAERTSRVDRRALAAVIAWEAMHNIMRAGLRGVGPGKMHVYDNKWAGVLPFLPKGDAIPQQVEALGLVPKPKNDDDRRQRMTTPEGALSYIGAGMRGATDIAAKYGFSIANDLVALTSFYQGYDLPKWEAHVRDKQKRKQTTFVAADPIPVWTASHVAYLEIVLR